MWLGVLTCLLQSWYLVLEGYFKSWMLTLSNSCQHACISRRRWSKYFGLFHLRGISRWSSWFLSLSWHNHSYCGLQGVTSGWKDGISHFLSLNLYLLSETEKQIKPKTLSRLNISLYHCLNLRMQTHTLASIHFQYTVEKLKHSGGNKIFIVFSCPAVFPTLLSANLCLYAADSRFGLGC